MNARRFLYMGILAAALLGCAAAPRSGEDRLEAKDVKFYEPTQLSPGKYDTVEHLWVESWRTAVWYPAYSGQEEGVTALKAEAARLGANGVTNVSCSEDNWLLSSRAHPPLICYGLAIRVH
ncbi:MAG TPA: hypothetical protein VEG37_06390 [Burkholderiales bacterium]|nr:hypothetical protein [Burkholderiales bacterium]